MKINLNRIVKISTIVSLLLIGVSVFYFSFFFLPQKEKAKIELAKMEQEIKMEQIKFEKVKLELEKVNTQEEAKKEESIRQSDDSMAPEVKTQSNNNLARESCLADADAVYNKKLKKIKCKDGYYCDPSRVALQTSVLQTDRDQAKSECYRMYP